MAKKLSYTFVRGFEASSFPVACKNFLKLEIYDTLWKPNKKWKKKSVGWDRGESEELAENISLSKEKGN